MSDFSYWQLAASAGTERRLRSEKGGEAKRVWKKRERERAREGANACEEEGERENDSSSIYISSHSRLPETGAFPSKPGIGTKQMSFGKRMKTSLFLPTRRLAHYGVALLIVICFPLARTRNLRAPVPRTSSWNLGPCTGAVVAYTGKYYSADWKWKGSLSSRRSEGILTL